MKPTAAEILKWGACGAAAYGLAGWAIRQQRRMDFRHRVALITGGSRGLGLLLAGQFAAAGARVVICARDAEELARARRHVQRNHGREILPLVCDITDPAAVDRMVRAMNEQWGGIDILVNNAGVIQVGPQEEMTLDDYEHAMQVHYWGPLYTTLAVLPHMRQQRAGRIVNVSSIGGIISLPHLLPYSGSKFALIGLSQGLRAELLKHRIYVTTVCPGLMRTGSHHNALFKGQHRLECAWFSIGASAPVASMSADRAAHQILEACRYGRAQVVLSLPAKMSALAHGVAPGLTADALALVNRWLPAAGGIGEQQATGHESRPWWLPEWLTYLGDKAAMRNNELPTPSATFRTPPR